MSKAFADRVITPDMHDTIRAGVAAGKTSRELAGDLGLNRNTVLNTVQRHGLGPWRYQKPVLGSTIPDDFAAFYAAHPRLTAARHFGVAPVTIDKWAKVKGLSRAAIVREAKAAAPKRTRSPKQLPAPKAAAFTKRDYSAAGQAADFLRRFGPVVRCDRDGRYTESGDHWRRGNSLPLTPHEVIERAVGKGFVVA